MQNTADPSTQNLVVLEEGLPMYSHTYEGDMSLHRFNVTIGCWTAAAIASLYTQTSDEIPIIVDTSKSDTFWDAVPLWAWLLVGSGTSPKAPKTGSHGFVTFNQGFPSCLVDV